MLSTEAYTAGSAGAGADGESGSPCLPFLASLSCFFLFRSTVEYRALERAGAASDGGGGASFPFALVGSLDFLARKKNDVNVLLLNSNIVSYEEDQ